MIIQTKIKPNAKKFEIKKTDNTTWTISVKSAPENNAANREIIKELSKTYKLVRIIKGLHSRNKIIELT